MMAMLVVLASSCFAGTCGDPEFVPLIAPDSLRGWVPVNCGPATFSLRQAEDGTPFIHCTGQPTGLLRTERQYENFILELEWMHELPAGNAGLFVWSDTLPALGVPFSRSIEVQVMLTPDNHDEQGRLLYTGQGDVFSIWGAKMTPLRPHPAGWERCLPSERRTKGAGEWNHYRVVCDRGSLRLSINGAEVSGGDNITPRRGVICLESEGTPVRFRNIRIAELPPTTPALSPEQCASFIEGFRSIQAGPGLAGWLPSEGWAAQDSQMHAVDGSGALATPTSFGDYDLQFDWKWTGTPVERALQVFTATGREAHGREGALQTATVPDAGSRGVLLRGDARGAVALWCNPCGSGCLTGVRGDRALSAEQRAAAMPAARKDAIIGSWNRTLISVRGTRVSVTMNGAEVVRNAAVPGLAGHGPIVLDGGAGAIAFANVMVREVNP